MNRRRSIVVVLSLILASPLCLAQGPSSPVDGESIDSILTAVYEVISGPAGQARDWDRFRALFLPEARLVAAFVRQGEPGIQYRAMTPAQYAERSGPILERDGFFESEIHREVDRFGPVAQVFSTYESRRGREDAPFARGINSFQLFNDGERWWILTIYWTGERPDLPIPEAYQPEG